MIRIGFFGTPELSAQVLQDFLHSPDFEVAFVVTGEDKPIGRHQILTANPVKEVAIGNNTPFLQPARIRGNTEFLETITSYEADYFVVVAYGKILPKELLEIPKKYPINIHGSILPKYRGASPIQASLIAGDPETGVTIMVMNEKMDEGDMIDVLKIQIAPDETTETLFGKFKEISGSFAIDTIKRLDAGTIKPRSQDESQATYCKKITKEEGFLDFTKNAEELYHLYQGLTPWPGVYTFYHGKKLIIEKCFYAPLTLSPLPSPLLEGEGTKENIISPLLLGEGSGVRGDMGGERGTIGTVVQLEGGTIGIACGKGILTLSQVKLEGKKSQSIKEFLNGQREFIGNTLPN